MNKKLLLFFLFVFVVASAESQALFTYGKNAVQAKEFMRAYNKTNTGPVANKEKSIREYLDLFIASKLKVREAYNRRYDTLTSFRDEMSTLRSQVAENYMTDAESINKLINEAFDRSQKDIRVSHIFIPYKNQNNISDSAVMELKIAEAHMQLLNGKSFEEVAMKYSQDPSVNTNKGDLGFITVFSLPYEFENIVYALAPGKFSTPYKSAIGYHLFKKTGERKAIGKIKAAQIMFAIPPGADDATKKQVKQKADSVYTLLVNGGDFSKLARQFSNDYVTAASEGLIPDFGIGTYDPLFENTIIGLPKDGAFSQPFLTSHGYHIVKRISITPVPASLKNKPVADEFRARLEKDPRINVTKEILYKRIIAKSGYSQMPYNEKELWLFADSVLDFKRPQIVLKINNETPLFKLGDKTKTVSDFFAYALANRYKPSGTAVKTHQEILEEFKRKTAFEVYREHLEDYNEEFRNQINDLKDGNMFFEIMMRDVWAKAQNDSTGQKDFFEHNKNKYQWKNSADAVIFYCSDDSVAQQVLTALKKNPADWKEQVEKFNEQCTVDSGRFDIAKIPGLNKTPPKAGLITDIEKNKDDNSAAFALLLKIYTQPSLKTFTEAKGDVVTDYQNELEAKWVAELKKKYPVVINQKVLQSLIK
ncbi:MAG: hypothetical protein EPN92_02900 [Chitinophagaceae bacterium]|nr:MAG: hypothetical protein EPN92_02900 [Chitinophagaceae bacterium]